MSYDFEEAYKSTVFEYQDFPKDWPKDFAILTAYATTGETWTDAQNKEADQKLEAELRNAGHRLHRISGYSSDLKTYEEGWAVAMPLQTAWELAIKYKQVALFYYRNDELLLVYALNFSKCDEAVVKVPRPIDCKNAPYLSRYIKSK